MIDSPLASWHDRRVRPLLAVGALLAAVISAAQSPAPAVAVAKEGSTNFTLGVLRRDAMVVPFATYDGKRWENHWPQPSQDVDVPINLRSVPGRWWGQGDPPISAKITTLSSFAIRGRHIGILRPDDTIEVGAL